MINNKKGIELIKSEQSSNISITIGDTKLKPQGCPTSIRFEKQKAYVYLVIDTSGSMSGDKLEQAKKGALDFARDAFRKEYEVGLISFNSIAKLICEPTYDIKLLKSRIFDMDSTGSTNMAEAIKLAHAQLRKYHNTKVIVIATDGAPDNEQEAITEGVKAKKDNIDIITIGTDDANQSFLKRLASRSELGKKVTREVFSQAISSASNLLPLPKSITKR